MFRIIVFVYFLHLNSMLELPVVAAQVTKTWNSTSDTSYLQFWNTRITLDTISFHSDLQFPLMIPKEDNTCEGIFPLDDETMLNIDMDNSSDIDPMIKIVQQNCPNEGLKQKTERIHWTDPRNWKVYSFSEAIPHLERIPCEHDTVSIPNKTTTFVLLPDKPIKVQNFRFSYRSLDQKKFTKLAETDESFFKHFVVKGSTEFSKLINITGQSCLDRTGCVCGTFQFEDDVCSIVSETCQTELPCERPIQPYGHCCMICGSVLMLSYNKDTFVLNKLSTFANKFISEEMDKTKFKYSIHVSKVLEDSIHIILIGQNEYSIAVEETARNLRSLILSKSQLGVEGCSLMSSGSVKNLSWGLKRYAFVIFAVVLIIVFLLIYYNSKIIEMASTVKNKIFNVSAEDSSSQDVKCDSNHSEDVNESSSSTSDRESTSLTIPEVNKEIQLAEAQETEESIDLLDSFT